MTRPQCCGVDQMFNDKTAQADLKTYYRKGPNKATRVLIEQVSQRGVQGSALLDIGGGIGVIQHALVERGAAHITHVDASRAYLETARQEATRRGHADRVDFRFGDFVDIAPELEQADIVTLDRVICCYDDMPSLVEASAKLARRAYGIIIPLDRWWVAGAGKAFNALLSIFTRNPYRMFIHPTAEIERILAAQGLRREFYKRVGIWQVAVYARS
ncbi:MAG: methyltransferase domain-containing protein [Anaerolineae bacterium]|nr:MAG: methyltransferase domain-containing protein [Anaerolineae bacterium]